MRGRIRIAYISATSELGGAEVSLTQLADAVDRTVFEPVALLPSPGRLTSRLEAANVPISYIPMETRRRRHPIGFYRSRKAIEHWLRETRPDVVHVNSFWAPEIAVPAAKAAGVKVIYHLRDFYDRIDRARAHAFRSCDALIAISKCVAADVKKLLPDTDPRVIYNFVDSAAVAAAPRDESFRKKLGWEDLFVIGVASRLSPEKGQMDFLYAASMIAQRFPNVRFLVVGGSQFTHREGFTDLLQEQLEKLGLTERLAFTGFVDNVASIYKTMNVCVLASVREPFGRVVIESMAAGTPVVATKSGGPEEILEDRVTGLLVEPSNPKALASACKKLICDKDLRTALSARALDVVQNRFGPDRAREVEALYRELAQK